MSKDADPGKEVTPEELAQMTLPEKVKRHALDVMRTHNNPQYLRMGYQRVGGSLDGNHVATYVTEEESHVYDFLFGGGSLGHPMKPSIVGEAVYEVARLVEARVMFLDFTFADFTKEINAEAIETAFYPIFEQSENMKAQDRAGK